MVMKLKVWLTALLALVFLTEPAHAALHHHADHHSHVDCQVCQLLANLASISPASPPELSPDTSWVPLESEPSPQPAPDPAQFSLRPRAPPAISANH
jgi:hypothetical protein